MIMGNMWNHFKTITYHKYLVAQGCFRVGLIRQGILHDMSKYSPTEFLVGAKYFQGTRSPNNAEREDIGYSNSWMHHKGRNKHHYEYWIDYSNDPALRGKMVPVEMPDRYVAEMIMDRIAASKVYKGEAYDDSCPLQYFDNGTRHELIHPKTCEKLEYYLRMLAEKGERETFAEVKKNLVKKETADGQQTAGLSYLIKKRR